MIFNVIDGAFLALGRMGSLREKARISTGSLQYGLKQNGSIESTDLSDIAPQSFHKAVLYVLGEKAHVKVRLL